MAISRGRTDDPVLKALVMQSGPELRSPELTRMPGGHGGPPVISASDVRDKISTTCRLERLSRHQQALGLTETLCFNN